MAEKKRTRRPRADSVKALKAEVNQKVLELTEANQKLKRKIFDLYTIFELSRNFNAVLNYETLLDSFVLTSLGQMGAAKAALYLPLQVGKKEFHLARVKGSPPLPEKEIVIDPDGQFGKYITALNRPVNIEEIERKFSATDDISFVNHFPSGIVVPMIYQTKLRGVLIISVKISGQQYRDDDIEFLSILANQTAVSIENARLFESEKFALDRLQKTQELLVQSERSAALGELSAKIAHEVNNPLGIIKNYLLLAKRVAGNDSHVGEHIDVASQEIERIAMIVRQLLDIHRPRVVRFVKTNPERVVREVLTMMQKQLEVAGIRTNVTVSDGVPEIMAWPDGLKQVFINLIVNARDAMKDGGTLEVKISRGIRTVEITMCDTGPGIDPRHIPYIFEPFFTTKEERGGTGLGLSVSSGIIKSHGGSIDYHNTKMGGCFEIRLPIEQEEEAK